MTVQTQENIKQSLSKLQRGLPLHLQDIFNIAWEFNFLPNKNQLLMEIHSHNPKLAESLLIFRKKLRQAADGTDLESVIDHLILHYIINTDGLIPEMEGEDIFDVFDAASRYAQTMCIDVIKGQNDDVIMQLNGKDIQSSGWSIVPGWSAALSLRQIGLEINRARYGRNDVIPSVAFGFDERRTDYRLQNAMTLADFSHLAYFEPAYVEKHLKQWGYNAFQWIEDVNTDTQVFVAGKGAHLIVCFRGTSSGKDALIDVNFFKSDAFGGRGRVHRGFQKSLDSVWTQVQAAVDLLGRDMKLFFCGHSLGAALAQLAAHRFALGAYNVASIYVFGSPRVGNQVFKEAYNELLADKTFLHINNTDIVTQIPPMLLGFQYLGTSPRKFNNAHAISRLNAPEDNIDELLYEDLEVQMQEEIQQKMIEVQFSIKAATQFLNTSPQQFSGASYGTSFESGAVDNHGMDQYLFKFGCAIVDGEWRRLSKTKNV